MKSIWKLKENTQQLKNLGTVSVILKHKDCPPNTLEEATFGLVTLTM